MKAELIADLRDEIAKRNAAIRDMATQLYWNVNGDTRRSNAERLAGIKRAAKDLLQKHAQVIADANARPHPFCAEYAGCYEGHCCYPGEELCHYEVTAE